MGKIENLILQQSGRGMDLLRPHLSENFCSETAAAILNWKRGPVILVTGFYVAGHAETDGPPGTRFLAEALSNCGFSPVVVTDEPCRGYFERFDIPVRYLETNVEEGTVRELLQEIAPVGMVSVERCGENIHGDYANMRGVSIAANTASLDKLFVFADCPTVGIGDGGNEIGMGNLAKEITEKLSLVPCKTCVDHLMIATVSNWGALGLSAALGWLPDEAGFIQAYEIACELGHVDGITKLCELGEDGFSLDIGLKLVNDLKHI